MDPPPRSPLKKTCPHKETSANPSPNMQEPNPIHILLLEDDPAHAELARRALIDAGIIFVITRVETRAGFEGQLNDTAPDIILSDYRLPTFDGLEALRIVQGAAFNIPFIFVTGTMGEEVAIETLKIGATDYVLKTHLARLGPSVRRALSEALERRERHEAEVKLLQSNEQLRALTAHLQQVREQECIRIARQVHDELGQALTGLKLDLSWLVSEVISTNEELGKKVQALADGIDATIQIVRQISTDLRPGVLDNLGLIAAIEWQANDFQLRTGVRCTTTIMVDETMWGQEFSTTFFRIFQETLTNIIRHAAATQVEVVIAVDAGRLVLIVRDNGSGITEAAIASVKSIGLVGIRERAALLGGAAVFSGGPGLGTIVTVSIPLTSADRQWGQTP
ncbi:MAG: response regulator [Opitutus sp.]|nr:response regulator [Opitutus sp.]MCS6273234.1 response regulator [Opitutus sp.]